MSHRILAGMIAMHLASGLVAANEPSLRWYPVPVVMGTTYVLTDMYFGVPFRQVGKPLMEVDAGDPAAAVAVKAFYAAALSGDAAKLKALVRLPAGASDFDAFAKTIHAGIGEMQEPVLEGIVECPNHRAAVVVRGTSTKGRSVRLHWLEADDGGRYRVAQPANPGPGDLLLNEVILASAVDPMRFSARSKSPEGPGRSTVLISTGSADPALAPRLNVRGIRLDLPVFDPTSDSSDLAIQFYLKAYRDLRNGRKNEFEQAVHEQSRAGATRSLENMTGEDNRMLLDSLKDRKLVYAILGEHFEFIFYVSNAGPSVTSLAALHEGVVIDGSKYAIRPASDQSAIDQVLSDSDLQKTLAMPIAR